MAAASLSPKVPRPPPPLAPPLALRCGVATPEGPCTWPRKKEGKRSCSFIPPPASALTFGESRIANFAAAEVGLAFAFA